MKLIMNNLKIYLTAILLLFGLTCWGQVGIANTDPKASLHVSALSTGTTTAEGIIAPILTRAQLISKDPKYTSAQIGTWIYVSVIDGTATLKTRQVVREGYYCFNGEVWEAVDKAGHFFYLPAFTLPLPAVGRGYTFDLYNDVYKHQFSGSGNTLYHTSNTRLSSLPATRLTATDLDYVVTHYDAATIKINSISTSGIINYDVLNTISGPDSFLNVVVVTK